DDRRRGDRRGTGRGRGAGRRVQAGRHRARRSPAPPVAARPRTAGSGGRSCGGGRRAPRAPSRGGGRPPPPARPGGGRARRAGARRVASGADALVVEGVGGLLVPLTTGYAVRDFALDLELPLVVAARPGLGTINHTLLTLEAARAAGLTVRAVVITPWPAAPE